MTAHRESAEHCRSREMEQQASEHSVATDEVVAAARELYAPHVTYLDIPRLQKRLKEALARLDAAPDDGGWRRIETAPPIGPDDAADVWQVFSYHGTKTNQRRVADAFHDGVVWCDPDGDPLEWQDEIGQVAQVTHWRPLPAPPAAPREEGEG